MSKIMPINAAAKTAGIPLSRATMARLARSGKIPAIRIGTRWFAIPDDLTAALISTPKNDGSKP